MTGASRGIGRAIATGLAANGAAVAVGYVNSEDRARETVRAITEEGGTAVAIRADLSRPAEVLRLFDEAEKTLGSLDIVVANAADALPKPLVECTEEDRDREVAAGMSPFGRVGAPGDVADVAVFLAGPQARWVTGQNVGAGGGVF
ncbi:hypothetical protein GCM10022403_027360 [Streptomyces coacervatus]|uniref:SDR family oxidoreductase n=1 Tax=Streptomyces coacervatus TaxID=647381 RepID=A0ABP7HGG9_9ACTN|nr:SDR family oxidoreductase [Streptomyces coacervatus]MDF2265525.1 SDR family oxidoreductase [Streptomyces coacervatus]